MDFLIRNISGKTLDVVSIEIKIRAILEEFKIKTSHWKPSKCHGKLCRNYVHPT